MSMVLVFSQMSAYPCKSLLLWFIVQCGGNLDRIVKIEEASNGRDFQTGCVNNAKKLKTDFLL